VVVAVPCRSLSFPFVPFCSLFLPHLSPNNPHPFQELYRHIFTLSTALCG
jgi:hypothetical protein